MVFWGKSFVPKAPSSSIPYIPRPQSYDILTPCLRSPSPTFVRRPFSTRPSSRACDGARAVARTRHAADARPPAFSRVIREQSFIVGSPGVVDIVMVATIIIVTAAATVINTVPAIITIIMFVTVIAAVLPTITIATGIAITPHACLN